MISIHPGDTRAETGEIARRWMTTPEFKAQKIGLTKSKKKSAAKDEEEGDESDQLQTSQQFVASRKRGKDKKRGRKGSGALEADLDLSDSSTDEEEPPKKRKTEDSPS